EDFEAWRGSLTPEESTMLKKQAAGEFNKKFRKSDEFKKDLPDEKVQSFSKILGKFFEAEADDYKKEPGSEAPDPDGLLFKGTESKMDFRLKSRIVEIDRDAERRYHFAALRTTHAAYRGEFWPSSSPMKDVYYFQNNDTDSHDMLVKAVENAGVPVEVPPVGEKFSLVLPRCLFQDINEVGSNLMSWKEQFGVSDDDYKTAVEKVTTDLILGYYKARETIEKDVTDMKNFFKSQSKDLYKTKADVMKETKSGGCSRRSLARRCPRWMRSSWRTSSRFPQWTRSPSGTPGVSLTSCISRRLSTPLASSTFWASSRPSRRPRRPSTAGTPSSIRRVRTWRTSWASGASRSRRVSMQTLPARRP
ncbi:unnamed protein product, partial [Prorocentrum cordatum]